MLKLRMRLCNKAGETLVESLMAILIFTMASIAMFSMCKSAADVNLKVKAYRKDMEAQIAMIEKADGAGVPETIQFECQNPYPANPSANHDRYKSMSVDIIKYQGKPASGNAVSDETVPDSTDPEAAISKSVDLETAASGETTSKSVKSLYSFFRK